MDKTVADYKAEIAANQATYEKEKAVVDAKMQRLRQLMTRKLKPITKSKLRTKKAVVENAAALADNQAAKLLMKSL